MTSRVTEPTKECHVQETSAETGSPSEPRQLSNDISVGRGPFVEELPQLKSAGFHVLINNRPDGEKDSPMTSAETAEAAAAQGLVYHHIPVEGRNPLERDVKAFAAIIKASPGSVYAYCHTGGRSASLWALASVATTATDALVKTCKDAGFDISGLAAKMDMRREMLADDTDD